MDTVTIICPSCLEATEVVAPPAAELPAELDHDCEVCCRPMLLRLRVEAGEIVAQAAGLGD